MMVMAQHYRHFYGPQNSGDFNFQWDIIRHDSFVVITASEGHGYDVAPAPQRIIQDFFFQVWNVAPHDGGVAFRVLILEREWLRNEGFAFVDVTENLWIDITVFDASDPAGQN
jgi:hypothetical protein